MDSNRTEPAIPRRNVQSATEIRNPTISERTQELLNHTGNLERECYSLRSRIFGAAPECNEKRPECDTLELMIQDACQRIACAVGDLATINGRL